MSDGMENVRCFCCGQMSHDRTDGPDPDEEEVGQAYRWSNGVLDVAGGGCRAAVLCWPCFWKYDPDMWVTKHIYELEKPMVPFDKLPYLDHDNDDCWDGTKYKWPLEE